jgi:hypothetical protein
LSRTVAAQMFSMQPWTQGAWPANSVVTYQGDVYRATAAILAANGPPGTAGVPWQLVDVSGGVKHVTADANLPATAPAGTVYLVLSSAQASGRPALFSYDAGSARWQQLGGGGTAIDYAQSRQVVHVGVPIGTVITYCSSTPPPGYLLCDGTAFDPLVFTELAALLPAHHTPDLRGQFIRGWGAPSGASHSAAMLSQHASTTGRPRTSFTAAGYTARAGGHNHEPNDALRWHSLSNGSGGNVDLEWNGGGPDVTAAEWTKPVADHEHQFYAAIQGGDAETAPDHVIMAYMIKATDAGLRVH